MGLGNAERWSELGRAGKVVEEPESLLTSPIELGRAR
jgi:hypothetical protein